MEFEFLKELGKIPSSSDWDKVRGSFNLQILDDVLADPSGYRLNEFIYGDGNEH